MLRKILRKSSAQEPRRAFFIHTQQKRAALRIDIRCCTWPTHYCSNFNFCSKNILQKHCNKIKFVWFCCSVFAAFFCFLTIKYTFETWFPCGPRVQQIFAENFMFIILQHVFARKTQQVNWRRKIQIDWVLQRKQRIMGYTGDNKKPKSAEKRGTRRFIGNFQSRSWKKLFMH